MDAVGNRTQVAETLAPLAPLAPTPLQSAPGGLPAAHATPTTLNPAPGGLPTRTGPSATMQTLTYGYDRLYRLTSATGGPAGATSYTYDPVGNRLTRTRASVATTYAYDRADRITSATTPSSGTSYTVNAVGNMTLRGSDTFTYDQANRLTGIDFLSPSTPDANYTYDGDGKRTSKTVGSTTTSYVYDVNRGLPVLLEDGTRRYVWGLGLAYEVEGSAALVYHVDGLGSVRALTDSTKAVVQTYESDEFGVPITTSGGSAQPFGFTGEQRDSENGLTYLRARYYDPSIGRFISRDPFAGMRPNPGSLHRFIYAWNRPTVLVDPSGLDPDGKTDSEFSDECFKEYGHGRIISAHCMWLIWMREIGMPMPVPGGTVVINVPLADPRPPGDDGTTGGGGPSRRDWEITDENTSREMFHPRFGNFYEHTSTGLWWTRDRAGHGGSVWKVYRRVGNMLVHEFDADRYGDRIDKWKGPTGDVIPWSELRGR